MHKPFPDNSKKIWHLYATLMVLKILTLNVVRCIGFVMTILKRYDNCMKVPWYLEIIYLTLFMRVVTIHICNWLTKDKQIYKLSSISPWKSWCWDPKIFFYVSLQIVMPIDKKNYGEVNTFQKWTMYIIWPSQHIIVVETFLNNLKPSFSFFDVLQFWFIYSSNR